MRQLHTLKTKDGVIVVFDFLRPSSVLKARFMTFMLGMRWPKGFRKEYFWSIRAAFSAKELARLFKEHTKEPVQLAAYRFLYYAMVVVGQMPKLSTRVPFDRKHFNKKRNWSHSLLRSISANTASFRWLKR